MLHNFSAYNTHEKMRMHKQICSEKFGGKEQLARPEGRREDALVMKRKGKVNYVLDS
jgi:hypothetical protein